jgi:hypothetical protein
MNVWFIYKHTANIHPFLYAITDDKELCQTFLETRRSDLFEAVKKDLKKEDYKYFLRDHLSLKLGIKKFRTKSKKDSLSNESIVEIVTTDAEEMDIFMRADETVLEIGKYTQKYPQLFNKKLLGALLTLHYFEIYKFCVDCDDPYLSGVDIFDWTTYKIDELGIFLYLYGNTLDKKKLMKE